MYAAQVLISALSVIKKTKVHREVRCRVVSALPAFSLTEATQNRLSKLNDQTHDYNTLRCAAAHNANACSSSFVS